MILPNPILAAKSQEDPPSSASIDQRPTDPTTDHEPRTTDKTQRIVNLTWKLRRVQEAENHLFEIEAAKVPASEDGAPLDPCRILAHRFSDDPHNAFILLNRYEQGMHRELRQLITRFFYVQKQVPTTPWSDEELLPIEPTDPPVPNPQPPATPELADPTPSSAHPALRDEPISAPPADDHLGDGNPLPPEPLKSEILKSEIPSASPRLCGQPSPIENRKSKIKNRKSPERTHRSPRPKPTTSRRAGACGFESFSRASSPAERTHCHPARRRGRIPPCQTAISAGRCRSATQSGR